MMRTSRCQTPASVITREEASPSIGNTLWRVSTMYTRSAITPPEVNGFVIIEFFSGVN